MQDSKKIPTNLIYSCSIIPKLWFYFLWVSLSTIKPCYPQEKNILNIVKCSPWMKVYLDKQHDLKSFPPLRLSLKFYSSVFLAISISQCNPTRKNTGVSLAEAQTVAQMRHFLSIVIQRTVIRCQDHLHKCASFEIPPSLWRACLNWVWLLMQWLKLIKGLSDVSLKFHFSYKEQKGPWIEI